MASPSASVWRTRLGTAFRLLAQAILIFAVSVFVLVERGTSMCDPFFLLPFSLFSALLVGPILIGNLRKHPGRSPALLACGASAKASGAVLLILILSLVLVNLAYWYGRVLLPAAETCVWTVVLSATGALAAALGSLLCRPGKSSNLVKWVPRALGFLAVLLYKYLPPEWPFSWYGVVSDWGITTVALAFEMVLLSIVTGALVVLKSAKAASGGTGLTLNSADLAARSESVLREVL